MPRACWVWSDAVDFGGRHALVTGGSTGIGLAAAQLLAARGARVSIIARNPDRLEVARALIADDGGTVCAVAADVADAAAQDHAIDRAESAFGPVELVFANAGTGGAFGPLTAYADAMFEQVMVTNLTSVFRLLRRLLPGMLERGCGSVVVTGSLASVRGMPMNPAYVASKHGVMGLAMAAAAEGAPAGVRVNCVLPGFIDTPMLHQLGDDPAALRARLGANVPQGRVGSAREAAELVAFLLSDAASHITAQTIAVDGGILGTLMPRL
ncbi:SDR family NAD(P)-dependent oxidoreductase [Novosphingobium sp.]|uniref:SDR family NAD(P)-dependent oxidoreductase n=1 Tax=Novosphingobium sp. TaxID=1874826 RepID=UPI00333EEEE2